MAHILVYLQRTPRGLHPGSAVALSLARDVASERGATVTAVCHGDAGSLDRGVARAAGRFGADTLMFGGPNTLAELCDRLRPVHVITPWSDEGLAVVTDIPSGPATPRWVHRRRPGFAEIDGVTGVIAGAFPWYDLSATLEADYGAGVDDVALPTWTKANASTEGEAPVFEDGASARPLQYVAPADVDAAVERELAAIGAGRVQMDYARAHRSGTLLWLDAGPNGPVVELAERDPAARVMLLPGPMATFHDSWRLADWVLPGPWLEAVRQLQDAPWTAALT